jgi:hypothetical protein
MQPFLRKLLHLGSECWSKKGVIATCHAAIRGKRNSRAVHSVNHLWNWWCSFKWTQPTFLAKPHKYGGMSQERYSYVQVSAFSLLMKIGEELFKDWGFFEKKSENAFPKELNKKQIGPSESAPQSFPMNVWNIWGNFCVPLLVTEVTISRWRVSVSGKGKIYPSQQLRQIWSGSFWWGFWFCCLRNGFKVKEHHELHEWKALDETQEWDHSMLASK